MNDTFNGTCSVCKISTKVRGFDIYVFGSEGVCLCHDCEMDVVVHIRTMTSVKMTERRDAALARNKAAKP